MRLARSASAMCKEQEQEAEAEALKSGKLRGLETLGLNASNIGDEPEGATKIAGARSGLGRGSSPGAQAAYPATYKCRDKWVNRRETLPSHGHGIHTIRSP